MKSLFRACVFALFGLLLIGQASFAAEPGASFSWTGPYVGAHLGYGLGDADTRFSPKPSAAQFINLAPTTLNPDPDGFVGGLQLGYNYQMGSLVYGLETDFTLSSIYGSKTKTPIIQNNGTPLNGNLATRQGLNWLVTLRPRLGYTLTPTLLLYGTAGLAFGEVSYNAHSDFRPAGNVVYSKTFNETKLGWTAGAGLEYALLENWILKAEYLYVDLGKESKTSNPDPVNPPFQVKNTWNTISHIFTVGVNYKF